MDTPKIRRGLLWTITTIVIIASAIFIFFLVSPWPDAILLRHKFNENSKIVSEKLEPFVPSEVSTMYDLHYIPDDKDAIFDVHFPDSISTTDQVLPTIVWIHGGGWVSGSKEDVANYCRILSGKGYTVVAIDYSLAPEFKYPTPVIQANIALDYLNINADNLHIDPSSIIIGGDSGGAHIAAQLANIISEPQYAAKFHIKSSLQRQQLKGVLLFCGAYDINDLKQADLTSPHQDFLKTALWAYTGTKDFIHNPELATASVADYVTATFPPSFITVGNADPLARQSYAFARKLSRLNVRVDTLFFPQNYKPSLCHEYQFNFNSPAGKMAMEKTAAFLSSAVKKQEH
ncbi:alpha/beta hydrolase [Chryseobacterium rhizoplanae]|uniref:alpha/beta hydrolase n=1 Tax=Chryseobacterium rhizoplanae TaxID=1609531 RepID=UPI001CE337A0|nr:alpha/beta hydrolase [Chryseobacterium rhizoplanae]UCA61815.1 alpha/beta hydrolase [Chryseobacterium rhizoplanae]